ncbi:MAG: TIGR04157 family glycosyltransferase [Tannerellaceae bacterium]|nr:TIGR04157 family glycosyltransferase [Tannerellaceae bacterium]
MNLYIFNENHHGAVSGVEAYIRELTAGLKNQKVHVYIVHLMSDKLQVQTEAIDGIFHWHFPAPVSEQRTASKQKQTDIYQQNVACLLQLYIQDKKDLVFHFNFLHYQTLAEALKKVFDCKLVLSIHYLGWGFSILGNERRFRNILEVESMSESDIAIKESYIQEKELFDTIDRIICLSQNTYQIVKDIYKQKPYKLSVVYNGLSDHSQTAEKHELRKKYRLSKVPVILFTGRIDEVKGVKYIIRAFKKVLEIKPDCRLIIAGNGDFQTYMKECENIWMNVTFTGLLNKTHLYELYTFSDIGVMMSFHEQCSYVAIEMMMHGLPIIGTTSTGLNEMIEEGISGLHVPIEEYPDKAEIDTALLANKLLYLIQNPKERKRMGLNARKRYLNVYSLPVFKRNMISFYKSLHT